MFALDINNIFNIDVSMPFLVSYVPKRPELTLCIKHLLFSIPDQYNSIIATARQPFGYIQLQTTESSNISVGLPQI